MPQYLTSSSLSERCMVWWPWRNTFATRNLSCARHVFLMSSSPKVGFIIANPRSNNLEGRRASKRFFLGAISKFPLSIFFYLHRTSFIQSWKLGYFPFAFCSQVLLPCFPLGGCNQWTPPFAMNLARSKGGHHHVPQGFLQRSIPIPSWGLLLVHWLPLK